MKFRLTIALIVQIVAILFSLNGWVDALQGGAAVIIVALLTVGAWALGRVRLPVLTWGSLLAAIVLSAVTVALLVIAYDPLASDAQFANNPMSGTISALNIVFRVASVAVIAGSVFYAIRIGDTRRRSS
jgi:hypothetical protein